MRNAAASVDRADIDHLEVADQGAPLDIRLELRPAAFEQRAMGGIDLRADRPDLDREGAHNLIGDDPVDLRFPANPHGEIVANVGDAADLVEGTEIARRVRRLGTADRHLEAGARRERGVVGRIPVGPGRGALGQLPIGCGGVLVGGEPPAILLQPELPRVRSDRADVGRAVGGGGARHRPGALRRGAGRRQQQQ